MGIPHYLAMTAAEFSANMPQKDTAWMACHFSSCSHGLSNLPEELPSGALLILDDSTPMECHDPETVKRQLAPAIEKYPRIAALISTGDELAENRVRIKNKGNYLFEEYRKFIAELKGV